MRLTAKKLVQWCNDEFKRLEIMNYEVVEVVRTRFRSHDYEAGACKLYVRFIHKQQPSDVRSFLCFYSLGEYSDLLKQGFKMYLKFESFRNPSLLQVEIDVKK